MVKKTEILIFILIYLVKANAQSEYSWQINDMQAFQYHSNQSSIYPLNTDSFALRNNIYQIKKYYTYTGKKSSFHKTLLTFDKFGHSINRLDFSDTGHNSRITRNSQRSFNEAGLLSQNIVYSDWKRGSYSQFFKFGDSNKLVETIYYNHKNTYSGKTIISYNEQGKRSSLVRWSSRNKILYDYHYHYLSNGKLKQIVLTDGQGKLKKVTDYTCDDAGSSIKKTKDTIKICSVKSYLPNGCIVTTTQSFNYNGVPQKSIEVRNSKDQQISYELYEGVKEKLKYSYTYTYVNNILTANSYRNYYNKKHPVTRMTEFDEKGRIIKDETISIGKRSKQNMRRNEFNYDEKGMIISEKNFEDNKLKCDILFSYTFY